MKQRIITATVIILVAVPLLIFGHYRHLFTAMLGILAFAGTFELSRAAIGRGQGMKRRHVLAAVGGFMMYVVYAAAFTSGHDRLAVFVTAVVALLAMCWYVFDRAMDFAMLTKQVGIMIFTAGTFAALSALYEHNVWLLLYPVATAMVTDMFAYFVGIPFGRHKLAPEISPKKSVEGALGGLLAATILGLVLLVTDVFPFVPWYFFIPGATVLSVIGQMGDLIASKIKRDAGIKDYSNLLPGHGGIIDRFDSWLLAGFVFWLVWTVI